MSHQENDSTSRPPLRLYLIRHGESVANVDWREFSRTPDQHIALTPRGREQARLAGEFLRGHLPKIGASRNSTRLWCSPYRRTRDTAAIIRASIEDWVGDYREDSALIEQQMGLFDGVGMDEWPSIFPREHLYYQRHHEDNGNYFGRAPQGESAFDVSMRIRLVFAELHRHYREDGISTAIIVAHGAVFRNFVMQWLHETPEWYLRQNWPANASIRLIEGNHDKGYIFLPEVAGAPGETPVVTHEKPHTAEFVGRSAPENAA